MATLHEIVKDLENRVASALETRGIALCPSGMELDAPEVEKCAAEDAKLQQAKEGERDWGACSGDGTGKSTTDDGGTGNAIVENEA